MYHVRWIVFVGAPRCLSERALRETWCSGWASEIWQWDCVSTALIIESSCSQWESRHKQCGQWERENSLWLFVHAAHPMTSMRVTLESQKPRSPVRVQFVTVVEMSKQECCGHTGLQQQAVIHQKLGCVEVAPFWLVTVTVKMLHCILWDLRNKCLWSNEDSLFLIWA